MFYKSIFPTPQKIDKTQNNILEKSQQLKQLILQCEWKNNSIIFYNSLDYICMFYTMEFYRQVMSIKYSKFYIEASIRTILITLENNNKKARYFSGKKPSF